MKDYCLLLLLLVLLSPPLAAQDAAGIWKQLAQPAFDPAKLAKVEDLTLVRDRIRITLEGGTIQFTQPLLGTPFGAAFRGRGRVQVIPPTPAEAQQLRLFLKQETLDLEFSEGVFCFTDKTFDEIAAKVQWSSGGPSADDLYAGRQHQREDLGAEIMPRLFNGVLSAERRALFIADLKTKDKGWVLFRFDAARPEEISVGRWADVVGGKVFDTWLSFCAGGRSAIEASQDPLAKQDFAIRSYQIDAKVTAGAELAATTRVTLAQRTSGERVLVFSLDSNLRVESVKDEKGTALVFLQAPDTKDRVQSAGDYVAVALAEPTQSNQTQTLEFRYAGKRVIRKVGTGNYFCQSFGWYPAQTESFASRVEFAINFQSPKKFALVATGNKISDTVEGDWRLTSWKSDVPLAVAGFAFGDYKLHTEKAGQVDIEVYANREADDSMRGIENVFSSSASDIGERSGAPRAAIGSLSPAALAKTIGTEVANTLRLFEKYFGPYPYKRLAVTNIPYSYGQGWPMLLYLSALSFIDSTQRNALGIRDHIELTDFFRAHESSHQWWGHRVGWKSYHDQWLSEGFAQFSGNLYVQFRRDQKDYLNRLRKDKQDLLTRDERNHVYESVGPLWMGERLASAESPAAYSTVVYNKGGFILHMLRMMMFDPRNQQSEQRFIAMMQDFCQTFHNKPASTEDFKTIVEKHMTPGMDLQGNRRMDWFFQQYVYGTGVPKYAFRHQVEATADGKWKVSGSLTRTGVPETWIDIVPLYLHRAGGGSVRIGWINAAQPETPFEVVLPMKPEKISINDMEDILAEIKQ